MMAPSIHRVRELTISYRSRRVSLPISHSRTLSTPRNVAALAGSLLANAAVEKCLTLHVNTQHALIGFHVLSVGTLNACLVHPTSLIQAALWASLGSCGR